MKKTASTSGKIFIYVITFIGILIVIISSKFILIPKLTIAKDIDALSLWIEIYGGIVAIFMTIAFINMFISKKEFNELKKELEKKAIELEYTYTNKINELDVISNEQNIKLVKYENTINSKTNFIMNYTRYLTSTGTNNLELIKLFEEDLNTNKSPEIYEILTNLCFAEIEKKLNENGKIDIILFKKGLNYLNEWLTYNIDAFDYSFIGPVRKIGTYMENLIKQKDKHASFDVEIFPKLEIFRKNLMQFTKISNYKNSNIAAHITSGFMTYKVFLEQLIDLQICYVIHGSDILINQYIDLLKMEYNSLKLLDIQENKSDSADEPVNNASSYKKYLDKKKNKYEV